MEMVTPQDDSPQRKRARVRLQLAASYYEAARYDVALDEIKTVMQIDPQFSDAFDLAGLIYQAMLEPDLAEKHFRHAIALNEHDAAALHNLGWLQCEQKEYGWADSTFRQALAIPGYTGKAKTLMDQGICQARAGRTKMAEDTLKKSYTIDRNNPVTAYNLSLLLFNDHLYEEALTYIAPLNNNRNMANAQSLWLGIKIERALNHQEAMQQLGHKLLQGFGDTHEASFFLKGSFDD